MKNQDNIGNLAKLPPTQNYCFDSNINTADNYYKNEYQIRSSLLFKQIKSVKFSDKKPYGFNRKINKQIKFYNLHCQGKAKILMFKYSNTRKSFKDWISFLNFAIPFLWKRFQDLVKYKIGRDSAG